MKVTIAIAALVALSCASAFVQAQGEKPATAPAAATQDEPKGEPQKDIKLVQGASQSRVSEDARHCLEFASNTEIIKCAEPYLPAKK